MLFILTFALVAGLDSLSKALILNGTLPLSYQANKVLAFSLNLPTWISLVVSMVCLFLVIGFYGNQKRRLSAWSIFALGLIGGGVFSNFAERLYRGAVTDFIPLGQGVLNLADFTIFLGIILLLLSSTRSTK